MSATDVAALIALCAALASAIGDVIRQRSAQEVTDKDVGHLELFWLSVRDPRWWMGGMGAVANYSLQAARSSLGSVLLVTALQVTSLLFALPIYARLAHHRVTRWEWTWAVLLAGSLAVLVTVGDPARRERAGFAGQLAGGGRRDGPGAGVVRSWARGCGTAVRLRPSCWRWWPVHRWRCSPCLTKGAVGAASGGFGAFLRAPEVLLPDCRPRWWE